MPPPGSHKRLTLGQKETLRRWILEGAEYELHWAFNPPRKSELPQFSHSDFAIVNPIDVFVQVRFIREGLVTSPAASKEALIRRVTPGRQKGAETKRDAAHFAPLKSPVSHDGRRLLVASGETGTRIVMLMVRSA